MGLEFTQEYLKMPSHVAWISKEEIIQTTDAFWDRILNWSFGKEDLI